MSGFVKFVNLWIMEIILAVNFVNKKGGRIFIHKIHTLRILFFQQRRNKAQVHDHSLVSFRLKKLQPRKPSRVAQSVARLTNEPDAPGLIPGPATYFRFSFR